MLNQAIRSIIDLLKLKKDARKTDLEIEKLEREIESAKSVFQIASNEEIRKYDPRVNKLELQIKQQREDMVPTLSYKSSDGSRGKPIGVVIVVSLVVFVSAIGIFLFIR